MHGKCGRFGVMSFLDGFIINIDEPERSTLLHIVIIYFNVGCLFFLNLFCLLKVKKKIVQKMAG